ncbi:MAG: TonB family protein [Acidobacteria bacterium]|nr:TonB family protein [Acidobacteriota bacterium]
MKICPKCQQQYPNGFQYCPNDTEFLITNEEYVRRTKPIQSKPVKESAEGPAVEVVPITNPFPEEAPTRQRPPVPPPAQEAQGEVVRERPAPTPVHRSAPDAQEQGHREKPMPQPFRRTEPVQIPKEPPKPRPQPIQQAAPTPPRPTGGTQTPQIPQMPGASSSRQMTEPAGLNFTLPDQGSLMSRLIAGLKNIEEIFKGGPPVRAAKAGEFQFLLPEEPLTTRIKREVQNASMEFKRDPRRFAIDFIKGEGSNRARRNTLLAGSEMAFVGYVTLYFSSLSLSTAGKVNGAIGKGLLIGFAVYLLACYLARGFLLYKFINRVTNKFTTPKVALEVLNWGPLVTVLLLAVLLSNYNFYCKIFPDKCIQPEEIMQDVSLVLPVTDTKIDLKLKEDAKAKKETPGGSKPKPKPASGGGGGGRKEPTPPSKGVPPQMALTPQIIPPSPVPPKIKDPTLVVASTIYGDPKAIPVLKGPIGDPTGVPAPPASGPGTGAGIGRGAGTGVGVGEGGGLGAGRGGNVGGGDMGLGGGGGVQPMSANLRPTILYKEKAKYTEEARQNKIQGTVVLNVVFTSDGRITSIRVVRGLPDGLTEKAIEAAQKIRFSPAVKNGVAVSVRGNLEFTFNLY